MAAFRVSCSTTRVTCYEVPARPMLRHMSSPGALFRPYERLVKISLNGSEYEVPESNTLLRALQHLAPEAIAHGRFCWNEDCQYCRVTWDSGPGTPARVALSCKLMVQPGMRIVQASQEIWWCLRELFVSRF